MQATTTEIAPDVFRLTVAVVFQNPIGAVRMGF